MKAPQWGRWASRDCWVSNPKWLLSLVFRISCSCSCCGRCVPFLFLPSTSVHAQIRGQAGIPTPTMTRCQCNNHAPSRKKIKRTQYRQIQAATLRQFPDHPYPSRVCTQENSPSNPNVTFREYAPSPLFRNKSFQLSRQPASTHPHGTPIAHPPCHE